MLILGHVYWGMMLIGDVYIGMWNAEVRQDYLLRNWVLFWCVRVDILGVGTRFSS